MNRERYVPLKAYVRRHGGARLSLHPRLRDQLTDIAVEEFPFDATDETGPDVLAARLRIRARETYGSILTMIIVGIIVDLICKVIWEWWKKRHAHQVLMRGWHDAAVAERDRGNA